MSVREFRGLLVLCAVAAVFGGCALVQDIARNPSGLLKEMSPTRVHPVDSARSFWDEVVDPSLEEAAQHLDEVISGAKSREHGVRGK